ncbi:hypothetical protein [Dickeya phage Coodle]|nr:putative HNH endonuclease [Dickeya phage PP35]AYN55435.1 hypothetical protein [Dickeya phage Coodle]AYN55632.1 putative homing endonuclease [Dickeya phage Kamild]
MGKLIYGVGFNDMDSTISKLRFGSKAYDAWRNMLQRCYDPKFHLRYTTYLNCSVCKEWFSFKNFYSWFVLNYIEGHQLDKDILVPGNKEYSPDKCVFIPHWLNSFTTNKVNRRGKYPIGVSAYRGGYVSHCNNPFNGNQEHLGCFVSAEEAYQSWLNKKLEHALRLKDEMDSIDQRLYPSIIRIIKEMR